MNQNIGSSSVERNTYSLPMQERRCERPSICVNMDENEATLREDILKWKSEEKKS